MGLRALSPSPATLILTRLSLFGELLFYSDDGDDGDGDDSDYWWEVVTLWWATFSSDDGDDGDDGDGDDGDYDERL